MNRTQFGRRAFSVAGPDIWNSLPATICTIDTQIPIAFRRALKTRLFCSAFDIVMHNRLIFYLCDWAL